MLLLPQKLQEWSYFHTFIASEKESEGEYTPRNSGLWGQFPPTGMGRQPENPAVRQGAETDDCDSRHAQPHPQYNHHQLRQWRGGGAQVQQEPKVGMPSNMQTRASSIHCIGCLWIEAFIMKYYVYVVLFSCRAGSLRVQNCNQTGVDVHPFVTSSAGNEIFGKICFNTLSKMNLFLILSIETKFLIFAECWILFYIFCVI